MNATNLAVFMFAVLLSVGAVDSFGLFGSAAAYNLSAVNATAQGMTNTAQYNINSSGTAAQVSVWGSLWYIVHGFSAFLSALSIALNIGGYLGMLFPFLPPIFTSILTLVVDVIYGIGIIQFLTGRSEKLMK